MTRLFDQDVLAFYVPAVLAPNGRYERIRELVTSIDYLDAKVTNRGPEALIADVRSARRLAPTPDAASELQAIETAVIESARILRDEPGQLRGQLLCRVPRDLAADVNALLDDAARWRAATWLRPHGLILGHGYLASFGPADGSVDAVAISDDASLLIAGDRGGGLAAWDLRSRELLWRHDAGSAVSAVAFVPGSHEAYVALTDGTIARWSLAGHGLHAVVALESGARATSLAVSDTALVYGSDRSVYCRRHDQQAWRGSAHGDQVTGVALAGNGERVVSCSLDGSIAIWDTRDGRLIGQLPLTADRLLCAAALPGSDSVAIGTAGRLVLVVDAGSGHIVSLRGHANQVRSVAGLPDARLVSGSYDGQVLVWDVAAGSSRRVGSHSSWCLSVAAPRRRGPVVSGSRDGLICVWDSDGAAAPVAHSQGVRALAVGGDVAYACVGKQIRRLDLSTGCALPPLAGHRRSVVALAIAPSGLVSSSYDNTVRQWAITADPVLSDPVVSDTVLSDTADADAIAITADGATIVAVARDATWHQWDAATGSAGPVGRGTDRYRSVLALTPDGETLVTATSKHRIEAWQRRTARLLMPPLEGHTGYVEHLKITPDGGRLVSGSWDHTVRVWSLATGACLRVLRHHGWILDLLLTSDGDLALSACEDGTITVIDLRTLTVAATVDAHHDSVDRLALSADDRTLFSIGSCQLKAWDTGSLSQLAVFDADVPLRELAVAGPDRLAVGTATGHIIPFSLHRAIA